jgi:VanZ family protein
MFILSLSVGPGIQLPESIFSADKIGHFVAYGILTWLLMHGSRQSELPKKKVLRLAVFLASTYGIVLEIVQWAFFPHRFFEVWDVIANITGALTSYLIFSYFITKN